jgi:hypothetical protein
MNSMLPYRGGAAAGATGSVVGTPLFSGQGGAQGGVRGTPLRDQFGLNDMHSIHANNRAFSHQQQQQRGDLDDDDFSVTDAGGSVMGSGSSVGGGWRNEKEYRAQLSNQLKNLPEPEFAYEIAIPSVEGEGEETGIRGDDGTNAHMRGKPLDAAEVLENARIAAEAELQEELSKRSSVLKKGLPRPAGLTVEAAKLLSQSALSATAVGITPEMVLASEMIGKVRKWME